VAKSGKPHRPSGRTDLKRKERDLLKAATKAARRADPMWSNFLVGAAVRSAEGRMYTGGNFENDSYGMTICAERAAIASGIAAEGSAFAAVAIAVFARPRTGGPASTPSPCGACRQVIYQYGPRRDVDTTVIFPVRGVPTAFRMRDLLPLPFEL
jgi:cytidine deaminase